MPWEDTKLVLIKQKMKDFKKSSNLILPIVDVTWLNKLG